ncbi:MAG: threonine-phosphate decarboxylase, partial [Pseudomonadota bacterium]
MSGAPRDHGGRLDLAQRIYGTGAPEWIDLSTGINPIPFPLPPLPRESWTRLPDTDATTGLL